MIFYLSLGACIPKTDFSQLLTVPEFLEHYQEHKADSLSKGEILGFWDYVQLHFLETDNHSHDDESSHDGLPLKTINCTTFSVPSDFDLPAFVNGIITIERTSFEPETTAFEFLSTILRPPILV